MVAFQWKPRKAHPLKGGAAKLKAYVACAAAGERWGSASASDLWRVEASQGLWLAIWRLWLPKLLRALWRLFGFHGIIFSSREHVTHGVATRRVHFFVPFCSSLESARAVQ